MKEDEMNILFLIKDPYVNERFGVMYLSAIAKKEGHSTKILDPSLVNFNELLENIKDFKADVIAYSTETGPHTYYLELNRKIKARMNILSIMGGPHPTFFPEVIEKESFLDGICIGEGEVAFMELLSRLSKKEDYLHTKNFWFRNKNGDLIKNELYDLINDLDSLPFPDREIFSIFRAKYFFGEWSFLIGRGCPFNCTYCFNHSYNTLYKGKGEIIRKRSVMNIIDEINGIKNSNNITFINFVDDNFVLGPKEWLEEFADRYPIEIGVPFKISLNPGTVDHYILKILKRAGCFSVSIGIETGNEKIRKKMLGRNISDENIIEVCQLLKEYNIKIMTQNILGLPVEEPYNEDLRTLKLNQLCKPDFAWASIFYPFSKTVLGEFAFLNSYVSCNEISSVKSYLLKSSLIYKSKREKRRIENLQKFFGIMVSYPFLTPILKVLIELPLHRLYTFIFFSWYGFRYKYKIQNRHLNLRNIFKDVLALFDFLKGLLNPKYT